LSTPVAVHANFETLEGGRARVLGVLDFGSVGALLKQGTDAIEQGHASSIDLSGVTGSDSAGLALLIEWMSVARDARRTMAYQNMPSQLHQLARLSEVEELLTPS
jgi:phospholipid transport system transporter-binding protein